MRTLSYPFENSSKHSSRRRLLLLVDPEPRTRETISELLQSAGNIFEVIATDRGASFERLPALKSIDLTVFNIGPASLADAAVRAEIDYLRRRFAATPLVLFVDCVRLTDIRSALRLGIRGFTPTYLSPPQMQAGLRIVFAGGLFVPAEVSDAPELSRRLEPDVGERPLRESTPEQTLREPTHLTSRECEVLRFLRQGRTNREIACELQLAQSTVKVHVRNILGKLRASSRMQAVEIATQESVPAVTAPDERVT